MALTGLQIFKLLPGGKKQKEANCKKCGCPTCMAFAMKLAKKQIDLNKCEFIPDDLRALLEESNKVAQLEVKFGTDNKMVMGGEIVLFRHDKKFVNPTCYAIELKSSDKDFDNKLNEITSYSVERIGEEFKVDAITLTDSSDPGFAQKASQVAATGISVILQSDNINNLKLAGNRVKSSNPLIYLQNAQPENIIELAKELNLPQIVSAATIDELVELTSELIKNNVKNIILNLKNKKYTKNLIEKLTIIRRAAIEEKFEPLGFPVATFLSDYENCTKDIYHQSLWAGALTCKYSNLVVLKDFDPAIYYSLITLRQNLYVDPQKPLQIEPKIYSIGDVSKNSPVMVTTNFALTYFSVAGEIESSGVPVHLVITPSDGMSVLTAWAANKFTGEIIAKAIKQNNVEELIDHRTLIIPGYVASLKEEIQEELPGWNIEVGTCEAVDIPDHLKVFKSQLITQ